MPDIAQGSANPSELARSQSSFRSTKLTVHLPRWGRIDEPWLEEVLQRSEQLVHLLPVQAHLEFSQEDHLPFTLVIARATPGSAVKCMVSFIEFLASIPTPPLARVELVSASSLDRNFHRNIEEALEPYFQDRVEVEPEPGRIDIMFLRPDPGWQAFPRLPMK